VQEPTHIGRKLRRFGARQQHAQIEGVEKPRFVDPLLLVHHDPMHQRDLAGWAAKLDAADLEPGFEEFAEARADFARERCDLAFR
jgi:hypothetical protein